VSLILVTDTSAGRKLLADWDHFHVLLEQLLHRVPSLANASLDSLVNIAETFTPDCKWIVGQAPEVYIYSFKHSSNIMLN